MFTHTEPQSLFQTPDCIGTIDISFSSSPHPSVQQPVLDAMLHEGEIMVKVSVNGSSSWKPIQDCQDLSAAVFDVLVSKSTAKLFEHHQAQPLSTSTYVDAAAQTDPSELQPMELVENPPTQSLSQPSLQANSTPPRPVPFTTLRAPRSRPSKTTIRRQSKISSFLSAI